MSDKGFVVRVLLLDSGVDDDKDRSEQTFVTEYEPDLDGIRSFAKSAGWPTCEIAVIAAPLLGGDGAQEISQWITDSDRRSVQNDPNTARLNMLEREVSSLGKHMNAGFAELKQIIADAVKIGGSVRRVSEEEIKAAYIVGARLPDSPRPTPNIDEALAADEPIPSRHRAAPMRTREMNGNPDFRSNSMAIVGAGAGTKIFSVEGGTDGEGLPKQVALPTVGTTLHKGTRVDDAGDEPNGMNRIR